MKSLALVHGHHPDANLRHITKGMPVEREGGPIMYEDMMAYAELYCSHHACMVNRTKFLPHVELPPKPAGEPSDDEDEESSAEEEPEDDIKEAT